MEQTQKFKKGDVIEFDYTKEDSTTTPRRVIVMAVPSDCVLSLDITGMDQEKVEKIQKYQSALAEATKELETRLRKEMGIEYFPIKSFKQIRMFFDQKVSKSKIV